MNFFRWRLAGASRASTALRCAALLAWCVLFVCRPARAADPSFNDEANEPPEPPLAPAKAPSKAPTQTIPLQIEGRAPDANAPTATPKTAAPVRPDSAPDPRTHAGPVVVSTDTPPALVWKWNRFSTADYLVSTAAGGITLAAAIVQPSKKHSLGGGILFDNAVRNAIRARPLVNRYIFRDASDVGLSLSVTWPFVGDALTAAWWYRGSRDVAQEMALIDLETLAISGALQGATNVFVSRERPYGRNCGTPQLPNDSIDCDSSGHYRSFFSGHTSFSFTSAALICVHHFENDLLGAPWDAISCAGGYAVAAATSTFRVVGDMHYASDVITGALLGTIVGYGVPLLHYRRRDAGASRENTMQLHLVPAPNGLAVFGIF